MESRRQVAVSWDSGGPDEAPPKVARAPACLRPLPHRPRFGGQVRVMLKAATVKLHFLDCSSAEPSCALVFLICISPVLI